MAICYAHNLIDEVIDLFEKGDKVYKKTGLVTLDGLWRIRPQENTIISGISTSGKSSLIRFVMNHLSSNYGDKHLIYGPEEGDLKRQILKMAYAKIPVNRHSYDELPDKEKVKDQLAKILPYVARHYVFLNYSDGLPAFEMIKEEAIKVQMDYGFQNILIDPMSYIKNTNNDPINVFFGDMLREFNVFLKNQDIHGFFVAHPVKPLKDKDGEYIRPRAFDIANTSDWVNMADNILITHRMPDGRTLIAKEKTKDNGLQGFIYARFDKSTGQYFPADQELEQKDWKPIPLNGSILSPINDSTPKPIQTINSTEIVEPRPIGRVNPTIFDVFEDTKNESLEESPF